ncbi:MAG: hypothetical protein JXB47_12940 [Anaerolineae bacterium]|nr:hypothetical protein [Anaerolineae bacterium]
MSSTSTKDRSNRATLGVVLIGLGMLLLAGDLFPGILFVAGAALIARSLARGERWNHDPAALALLGLWLLFAVPLNWGLLWPVLLIGAGLFLLFGRRRYLV